MSTAAQNQHHAAELDNQAKAEAESMTAIVAVQLLCECGWMFRNVGILASLVVCDNEKCRHNGIFYNRPKLVLTRAKEPLP